MSNTKQPIFRHEAVQRYIQSREQSVLPRFVSPKVFRYLWLLLGLLVAGGAVTWSVRVPIYASGLAVVVADQTPIGTDAAMITLALFLPPAYQASLQRGQMVYIQSTRAGVRSSQPILAVEPTILSPAAAQLRFGLAPGAAMLLNTPVAVALTQMAAPMEVLEEALPPETYAGSVYQAEIEIGSRRVISLIPLFGHLWRNSDAP